MNHKLLMAVFSVVAFSNTVSAAETLATYNLHSLKGRWAGVLTGVYQNPPTNAPTAYLSRLDMDGNGNATAEVDIFGIGRTSAPCTYTVEPIGLGTGNCGAGVFHFVITANSKELQMWQQITIGPEQALFTGVLRKQ